MTKKKFLEMNAEERLAYIHARIATSDIASAGRLNAEQSAKFISLVVAQTSLKEFVKTYSMTTPTRDLDNFLLAARQMRKPVEATDYTTPLVAATFNKRTLTPLEWIYPANLSYDYLEDNIEREDFEDTLMEAMALAIANDLEDLNINGDTTSQTDFLAQNDGWRKIAIAAGHVYDTNGLAAPEGGYYYTDTIFPGMLAAMPNKWKGDYSRLALLLSPSDAEDYEDEGSPRQTVLGDKVLTTQYTPPYKGIVVKRAPTMPDGTHILTIGGNLVRGVRREFQVERERKPRARNVEITITGRQDAEIEVVDAVVIAYDSVP
jgi:hypothetical protein